MGVLDGIRIIEIEGLGPAPFCGMHFADMGADVIVIERKNSQSNTISDKGDKKITQRGKRIVKLDLKNSDDVQTLFALIKHADGVIEGMRPGVMEKLGIGPDVCLEHNPKLVFGRVTGWGQSGPLSHAAGHDINYISLSGAAWFSGKPGDPPFAPPTLVGDVAGGALYLMIGMLAGLLNARTSGKGQVVDAAMVDGSAHMMNLLLSLKAAGGLEYERGKSYLDGPHWYAAYACVDGKYISIGSMEPKFYQLLLKTLGLDSDPVFKDQYDVNKWPQQKQALGKIIASKTRDKWSVLLEGSDVCFAPVLSPEDSAQHPHMQARGIYQEVDGDLQAMPAPRFSGSSDSFSVKAASHIDVESLLAEWK